MPNYGDRDMYGDRHMYGDSPDDEPEIDDDDYEEFDDEDNYLIDGVGFADPGGNSALRAATRDNPRNIPCPQCGRPNMLTPIDKQRGYRCDICADAAEFGREY